MSDFGYQLYCESRGRRAGEGAGGLDDEPCPCVVEDAFECICDCDDCDCRDDEPVPAHFRVDSSTCCCGRHFYSDVEQAIHAKNPE